MTATALVPALAFGGGAIAFASTDCAIGEPPWYSVTVARKDTVYTHTVAYASLPPGGSATRTISRTTTLTGSIEIEFGVAGEGSIIFASASAKVGVTLKGEASATDGSSMTLSVPNNTRAYHDYVFFNGTRTANGRWVRYTCSAGVAKVSSYGTWYSWEAQYYGVVRCDHDAQIEDKYGRWSIQYKAVSSCA
jgi:hypothetical protein